MSMKNCTIDCETLICKECGKPAKTCELKRNCLKIGEVLPAAELPKIGGPGTELKKLLSKIGIKAKDGSEGCKCSDRAKHMDYMEQMEPGWCEKNIEEILGWLQEEAQKRKLPFIKTIARMIVKRAIKNSKQS